MQSRWRGGTNLERLMLNRDLPRLELFFQAGLLQDCVGGVARQDFAVDGDMPLGEWAVPNLMVAFAAANPVTTVGFEDFLYVGGKVAHQLRSEIIASR